MKLHSTVIEHEKCPCWQTQVLAVELTPQQLACPYPQREFPVHASPSFGCAGGHDRSFPVSAAASDVLFPLELQPSNDAITNSTASCDMESPGPVTGRTARPPCPCPDAPGWAHSLDGAA